MKKGILLLGLVLGLGWQAGQAADISGKVKLLGTPPPEKDLPINPDDPTCGKVAPKNAKTQFYVTGKDGSLADVVVFISKGLPEGKKYEVPDQPLVIDQKGCLFIPYVSATMAGQKVQVKNSDPFLHNVNHAPMEDTKNRSMNVAQTANGPVVERTFDKQPDLFVRFRCDVHPWMFAFVAIFEHPFFAVTDKDGAFKISKLPPGKYTIEALHRKAGKVTKEITVTDKDQQVDFSLELKAP